MTTAEPFCPTCGAPTPAEPLGERGLCRTCYLEATELVRVPETIHLRRCGGCGSVEIDGAWRDVDEALADIAIERVTAELEVLDAVDDLSWEVRTEAVDADTIAVTAVLDLRVDGGWERRERHTAVWFEPAVCRRCSRIAGDDFGAIVQLRASGRTPAAEEIERARERAAGVLRDRVDAGDRDAFLTDATEVKDGLDLKLSTPRLGDQVATALKRDLGGRLETSRTLVTTDADDREVYRVTFTLRLGPYRRGDILATDDGALLVEGGTEGVRVLDLRTGERRRIAADALEATRVATREDATAVTVVAPIDERAVQVLHPETHEAVTVAYYDDIDVEGETVDAIDVGGELYLLPDHAG